MILWKLRGTDLVSCSAMFPRKVWRHALYPQVINKAQRVTNLEIRRLLEWGLGLYVPHPDISVCREDLYLQDGVHLSEVGFLKY